MDAFTLSKENVPAGAYYLSGDDGFLLKTGESYFRALLPSDSLSLYVIDRLSDVNEILSCIGVFNFDGTPNVVLVRDADAKLDDKGHSKLVDLLSAGVAPDYLVFCNVSFLSIAEKKLVTIIDCSTPDKYRCMSYMEKLFPYGIERSACSLLADYTENNLAKIHNESIKLTAYCGENKVTAYDVETLVAEDRDVQIFAFANSIINKNTDSALKQLNKLRVSGASNAAILSSLSGQFQRMLYCALSPLSDEELAQMMKIKPFAVKKAREIRGFNQTKLKNTLTTLTNLEQQFRSGVMSDETALNLAVSKLLS